MKEEIIKKISATLKERGWESALQDFEKYIASNIMECNKDFIIVGYNYGASSCILDYSFEGLTKHSINTISKDGCQLQYYYDKTDKLFFIYTNGELTITDSQIRVEVISYAYAERCKEKFGDMLAKMRNKQRLYIECPDERYMKAYKLSLEHNDKTFMNCINRMIAWTDNTIDSYVKLYSDFTDNSFTFSLMDYETGNVTMNGGMIFHGFPGEGYKENGSIQMNKSYGWQIHT